MGRAEITEKLLMKSILIFILTFILLNGAASGDKKWYEIYFTSPEKEKGILSDNNPEKAFLRIISGARKSICGAFYEVSSPAVIAGLIGAKLRGVDVRIVTERDTSGGMGINSLMKSGIPVVTDNKKGLMHNKFAVVDDELTWTGSFNLTENASKRNNNNVIIIHSQELAGIYTDEFSEMFNEKIFGNRKEYGPFASIRKKYHIRVDETDINIYFSPEDDVERIILKLIFKARESIQFMAFSFTSSNIGEAMIKKFRDGIRVSGLIEKKGSDSSYSQYVRMKIEGLPVKLDRNEYNMHHKVIIIDKKLVITGSYNFSRNADRRNDENILIIDNRDIAGEYLKEFNRLY